MIRGYLAQFIRHQGHLVWFVFQHQVHKLLFSAVAFNIEFGINDLFDFPDVLVAYMPFIGTGMNGNTISTKTLCIYSHLYYIWIITTAAVAKGSYFINVHRKLS